MCQKYTCPLLINNSIDIITWSKIESTVKQTCISQIATYLAIYETNAIGLQIFPLNEIRDQAAKLSGEMDIKV